MRIKSKFELNFVHIAVLAVTPLIMQPIDFGKAATIALLSIISFVLSALVCLILAKRASRNIKIFVAALISSLVVTGYELLVKNGIFAGVGTLSNFAILSSIILCIDLFYIDTKITQNYFVKISRLIFVYLLVVSIYSILKELLCVGSIAGLKIIRNYDGYEFFRLATFDFLLLGLLCALIDRVVALLVNLYNESAMIYNKYKHKIRAEKTFIYENYRRKNLLTSEVIINKIGEKTGDGDDDEENSDDGVKTQKEKPKKSEIKHKPRRKNKLRVSKEAKVEKLFDRKTENKEGKK